MCTSLKLTLFLAKSRSKISRIIIYMPVESYGWSILSRHSTYAIKTSVRIKRFNKQILLLHYIKRERLVKKKKDRGKEAVIHAHHLMCKWFWDSSQSSLAGILFWHQAVSKTSTLSMLLHHDTYHLPLDTSEKVHRFNDQPFMYAFKISFFDSKIPFFEYLPHDMTIWHHPDYLPWFQLSTPNWSGLTNEQPYFLALRLISEFNFKYQLILWTSHFFFLVADSREFL